MALSPESVERLSAEPRRYELLLYVTGDNPGFVQQETSMRSTQRGPVAQWPPRMGTRSAA
ncbi:hypothetical protein [Paraburkholderia kirstenboschensis]|uniref:hypothetical protein n=1 Tax=Paraburkholderia kirstenboschensis TaxID=1245436 RepID=UPI000A982658|nr:hypothetical protein [Paraburkholderia kirstenboschensis]